MKGKIRKFLLAATLGLGSYAIYEPAKLILEERIEEKDKERTTYSSLRQTLDKLGIKVEEEYSKEGERYPKRGERQGRIVIHVQDKHGNYGWGEMKEERERNLRIIEQIMGKIEVEGIGLESFVGEIKKGERIKERQEELDKGYFQERERILREVEEGESILEVLHLPEAERAVKAMKGAATGVLNIPLFDSPARIMDDYVLHLFGKRALFGLEEGRYQEARDYAAALFFRQASQEGESMRDYLRSHSEQKDNPLFKKLEKKEERWAYLIEKELAKYQGRLEERGLKEVSKEGAREVVVEMRSRDWAEVIARKEEGVWMTVGGRKHTPSYFRALGEKGISVVTIASD